MKSIKKLILYITLTVAISAMLTASVAAVTKDAKDLVYNSLLSAIDEIDLSAHDITRDELSDIFDELINTRPDLFFVEPSYTYTYTDDDKILTMLPKYKYTGTALENAKDEYDSFISGITDGVEPGWSDLEKLLYVHDYLVLHAEYDSTLTYSDVYSFARLGTGTCVSYTLTYLAVCEQLGINCDVAESKTMNHIWNVVELDGEWYHVDVTWDDTVPDMDGRVLHSNFLCSDEAIVYAAAEEHANWTCDYVCSSTKYDSALWTNVYSPFVYTNEDWYAVDADAFTLYKYDINDMSADELAVINTEWEVPDMPGHRYTLAYSGVGAHGSTIYYNSPTAIYSYNITTGESGIVHMPDTTDGYIYYFTIDDGVLSYNIAKTPNDTAVKTETLDLDSGKTVYTVTYMAGGEIYEVQYYLSGEKITPPEAPAGNGFDGWDSLPEVMPDGSITVTALFTSTSCSHEMTEIRIVTAPTCTKEGTAEVVCIYCEKVLLSQSVEPAHTPGEWHTLAEATCTKEGLRRVSCTVCGETTDEEIIPTAAHSFGEWTESADGGKVRTCTVCGHTENEASAGSSDTTDSDVGDTTDTDSSDSTSDITDTGTADTTGGDDSDSDPVAIYIIVVIFSGIIISALITLIVLRGKKRTRKRR